MFPQSQGGGAGGLSTGSEMWWEHGVCRSDAVVSSFRDENLLCVLLGS